MRINKSSLILSIFIMLFSMQTFAATPISEITDITNTGVIKFKIMSDPQVSNTNIDVTVHNGVVTLAGTVKTDLEASRLIQISQSVSGIKDVNTSQLKIAGSKQPIADTIITAKVKGQFVQQKVFGDNDVPVATISVETNNGIVSLTGTADTQDQANNAVKIAKSVNGVKSVQSNIVVK